MDWRLWFFGAYDSYSFGFTPKTGIELPKTGVFTVVGGCPFKDGDRSEKQVVSVYLSSGAAIKVKPKDQLTNVVDFDCVALPSK